MSQELQPEDSRCPPTYRREEAVRLLLGLGWSWDGQWWIAPPPSQQAEFNEGMVPFSSALDALQAAYLQGEKGAGCSDAAAMLHAATLRQQAAQFAQPAERQGEVLARPMKTAPRDGTMLRLLVRFTEHATEDAEEAWTIGSNSFDANGEDVWQFAGWCWAHDHFTEGKGTPIGWLPMHDNNPAAPVGVPDGWKDDVALLLHAVDGLHGHGATDAECKHCDAVNRLSAMLAAATSAPQSEEAELQKIEAEYAAHIRDTSAPQCQAIVEDKGYPTNPHPCSRTAKDGSRYCAQHAKMYERSPSAPQGEG